MKNVIQFIVIGLVIFSACSSKDDLIPYEEGKKYTFQFSSKKVNTKFTSTTLGRTNIRGENVFTDKIEMGKTSLSFWGKNDSGYFSYARQLADETEPVVYSPKRYFLMYPITSGNSWESFQELYLDPKYQVLLTTTIISTDETVTTPYGILDNCIKTVSEGEAYIENSMSHRPIKVHCKYTHWYKPGIGYIKGIIEENSDHGLTGSIKISIQLELISE